MSFLVRKSVVAKSSGGDDSKANEKRVAELEKQVAELQHWKSEVSEYLKTLGFGVPNVIAETNKAAKKKEGYRPPLWFCSYCWVNSKEAFQLKEVKNVSGEVDPREVWRMLRQERHLDGWLDKEFLGTAGLFDDIFEGLVQAKVMVAFISDEYAQSENCVSEFTFASKSLRIPIIPVIVGAGWNWKKSKLGLLLGDALYIDMTKLEDQQKKKQKIEELVQRILDLTGNEKLYLEATGQITSMSKIKVGDAVEKLAKDPLNFSASFQKTPIKKADAGDHLFASYWWPCEVIELDDLTGAFKLHYWGYESNWDCWIQKDDADKEVRPLQYPTLNMETPAPGLRVEVRLLQDTHLPDKYASMVYCWVPGTVVSSDGSLAKVKLDLDSRIGTSDPVMLPGCDNSFENSSILGRSMTGFQYVEVSIANLRRID